MPLEILTSIFVGDLDTSLRSKNSGIHCCKYKFINIIIQKANTYHMNRKQRPGWIHKVFEFLDFCALINIYAKKKKK